MNRTETTRMFLEDAFEFETDALKVELVDNKVWDMVKRPESTYWNRYGINPSLWEPARKAFIILVNIRDLMAPAVNFTDDKYLDYLVYWRTRLKIRLVAQGRLVPDDTPEAVEDLTEQIADSMGLKMWWVAW